MTDMFDYVLEHLNQSNYKHYASLSGVHESLLFKWMNGYVKSPRYSVLKKVYDVMDEAQ